MHLTDAIGLRTRTYQFLRAPLDEAWDGAADRVRPQHSGEHGGHTPVVSVLGRGSGRVSMAGLIAARPGLRTRLFYRIRG